ncbi:unnamed protein product [Vitrella brassicaformis CCMP3155]|uniref:Nuclear pore protein n=2 Tax=Vitrella brassicaformis TaxID=1169539 RepID=A0A0G4GFP7_VITBC|nr:unnamed protein product [Vitrella brassicaformis CCMP3155]|eukprot:CEM28356.1 unnamed protein product [Vitrella brassicaformis CCMP3155]
MAKEDLEHAIGMARRLQQVLPGFHGTSRMHVTTLSQLQDAAEALQRRTPPPTLQYGEDLPALLRTPPAEYVERHIRGLDLANLVAPKVVEEREAAAVVGRASGLPSTNLLAHLQSHHDALLLKQYEEANKEAWNRHAAASHQKMMDEWQREREAIKQRLGLPRDQQQGAFMESADAASLFGGPPSARLRQRSSPPLERQRLICAPDRQVIETLLSPRDHPYAKFGRIRSITRDALGKPPDAQQGISDAALIRDVDECFDILDHELHAGKRSLLGGEASHDECVKAMVCGSINYLEDQFRQAMRKTISDRPREAMWGGREDPWEFIKAYGRTVRGDVSFPSRSDDYWLAAYCAARAGFVQLLYDMPSLVHGRPDYFEVVCAFFAATLDTATGTLDLPQPGEEPFWGQYGDHPWRAKSREKAESRRYQDAKRHAELAIEGRGGEGHSHEQRLLTAISSAGLTFSFANWEQGTATDWIWYQLHKSIRSQRFLDKLADTGAKVAKLPAHHFSGEQQAPPPPPPPPSAAQMGMGMGMGGPQYGYGYGYGSYYDQPYQPYDANGYGGGYYGGRPAAAAAAAGVGQGLFGSGAQPRAAGGGRVAPLAYAKALLMTLRITDALTWMRDESKQLKHAVLYMALSLSPYHLLSGSGPLRAVEGDRTLVLGDFLIDEIQHYDARAQLNFIQVLDPETRKAHMRTLLTESLRSAEGTTTAADLFGEVDEEGRFVQGALVEAVVPPRADAGWTVVQRGGREGQGEGEPSATTSLLSAQEFEELCLTAAAEFQAQGMYSVSMKLLHVCGRHNEVVPLLREAYRQDDLWSLRTAGNPGYRPMGITTTGTTAAPPPASEILAARAMEAAEIDKFYRIYSNKRAEYHIVESLWETVVHSRKVREALVMAHENSDVGQATDFICNTGLVPHSADTMGYYDDLSDVYPRLLETYARLISTLSDAGYGGAIQCLEALTKFLYMHGDKLAYTSRSHPHLWRLRRPA